MPTSPAGEELPGQTIRGTVQDAATDEAMAKVRVEFLPVDSDGEWVQYTDSLGNFGFDSLPAGMATIEVFAEGYAPTYDTRLWVNPDRGHWIPLLLSTCPPGDV